MTKTFIFRTGDMVKINDLAIKGIPTAVGRTGIIINQLADSKYYDYEVGFDSISTGRFKEEELEIVNNFNDEWVKVEKEDGATSIPNLELDGKGVVIEDKEDNKPTKFGIRNISITYPTGDTDKDLHTEILNEIHDTYIRKNADYGNSFGDQFNEYGLLSLVIRLDDKLRRLKQLLKQEAQVKDESIRDTILDLSNYGIMGVMELDKQNK